MFFTLFLFYCYLLTYQGLYDVTYMFKKNAHLSVQIMKIFVEIFGMSSYCDYFE